MATDASSKLNRLASVASPGAVLLAGFLEHQGFSRDLQQHYVRSGWLRRVGRGAFARTHEAPTWRGALHALTEQGELPLHVGGRSALALHGRAHYLAVGGGADLDLFAPTGATLPAWFAGGPWDVRPVLHRTAMLPPGLGVEEHVEEKLPVPAASPERAALEVLYLLPEAIGPAEARELLEGLVDLRPARVAALLRACTSIRVKRLFLMLADRLGHPWLRRVDLAGVDLGRGKRSVAGGGVFVPGHDLAVPAELLGDLAEAGGG